MVSKIKDYVISDEELVYMVKENTDVARDYLYEKYSSMIHKELNKVKKSAYALGIEWSDLVQEALLGFSNALSSYDEKNEAQFATYATLCVKRKLLNYIEKYSTTKNYNLRNALPIDALVDGDERDYGYFIKDLEGKEPLNKVITSEQLLEVKCKFKDELTLDEKRAIELALDGQKPELIASKMGITVKRVYNLLYRARQKLKNNPSDTML